MGLSSWSLDHIAFSWRVIPKAFRIKDPWEAWNYLFILPYFMAGSSIMLPDSCQAYGIEGSRANPASSQ
jgi:hypothetical protein